MSLPPPAPDLPRPFRPWPGESTTGVATRPSPRLTFLGHRKQLRDVARLRSVEPVPTTAGDLDRAAQWQHLPRRTILVELLKAVIHDRRRHAHDREESSTALLWASHPALPPWWHRVLRSTAGRFVLPALSHERLWWRTGQADPAAGLIQNPSAHDDGLLAMPPEQIDAFLRRATLPTDLLATTSLVLRLARDPRPWPARVMQEVAARLTSVEHELEHPSPQHAPLLLGFPHLRTLLWREHQQAWAALLVRADVPPDLAETACAKIRAIAPPQRLALLLDRLERTPDFAWTPRTMDAHRIFALLLDDQGRPEAAADAGWIETFSQWMMGQLQPGPGQLVRPPQEQHPQIWHTLEQVPALLLLLAAWIQEAPAERVPASIRRDCQRTVARVPATAWRPLLLSRDPHLRLLAIRTLGDRAAPAPPVSSPPAEAPEGPTPPPVSRPTPPLVGAGVEPRANPEDPPATRKGARAG